jgi:hypothetical protein
MRTRRELVERDSGHNASWYILTPSHWGQFFSRPTQLRRQLQILRDESHQQTIQCQLGTPRCLARLRTAMMQRIWRGKTVPGSQLTTSVSRKSKTGSQLSRSWSYVDGYSGYFRRGDEEDEDEHANSDSPAEEKQFEVKFDKDDPMNPRNMSTARKWIVVFTLAFGSLCVTCVSSLYTTTYDQIDVEFHCSTLVSTLGLALFVWGLGLSPMVLGPISEFYGRRPVYIGAYIFFTIWLIPCGTSVLHFS